ncbi:MAG TPA: beta-ketoacyl-[acyl-carrier-protein] synthase II [Armatimonadetes bacterium]|nr:beta-ketoacyl-[acyl-carrier-protein] synthase II [Armatimonadota bacterium]
MDSNRIVVTGIGAVTPMGNSWPDTWAALVAGRSGVGNITSFDTTGYTSTLAAEVKDFDPTGTVEPRLLKRTDPFILFGVAAAKEALEAAHFVIDDDNAERVGIVFGSGIGGLRSLHANFETLERRGPTRVSPFLIPMLIGNMAAGLISIQTGARGPNKAIQTACATSAHCLGDAARMLQRGDADVIIAGGSEASIEPLALAGFASMKALSTRNDDPARASRPFDLGRDGFVMGEGGCALVLETLGHAEARGAEPLAELAGYGLSGDAYHIAAPEPSGDGAVRAMQQALDDAGLVPADLGYINAHATSTPAGDISEVHALHRLYGGKIITPVSGTKSMTAHLLGAAGALETAICIAAIREGILPPTINNETPDPECDIDCVPNEAREVSISTAMCNSFGFGGHNCSLIVRGV